MSVEASRWAWEQNASSGAKLVLIAMADHSDPMGYCWPGSEFLAKKCGLSRSTIWRHIESLEKAALIQRKRRSTQDGRQFNSYQLAMGTAPVRVADSQRPNGETLRNVSKNRRNVSPEVEPLSPATSQDRTETISKIEPSEEPPEDTVRAPEAEDDQSSSPENPGPEPERVPSNSEIAEVFAPPEWYANLCSLPGFSRELADCTGWIDAVAMPTAVLEIAATQIGSTFKQGKYTNLWMAFQTRCRLIRADREQEAAKRPGGGRARKPGKYQAISDQVER